MAAREERSYPRLTVRRQAFPRPLNAPAPTCWMRKPPSSGRRDQNPWSCPRNAAAWLEQGGCKHAAPVGSQPAISVCRTTFREGRLSARTMSACANLRNPRQGSAVTGPSPRWWGHAGHQGGCSLSPPPAPCDVPDGRMQQQSQIGIGPLKASAATRADAPVKAMLHMPASSVSATFPCGRNAVGQAVTNRHGPIGAR